VRSILALALFVLAMVLLPPTAAAQSERVIFDAATRVTPGEDISACIDLEPGNFVMQVQAVGDRPLEPVRLSFDGYRGFDPEASIAQVVTHASTTATVRVIGGFYCFSVFHGLSSSQFATMGEITSHAQLLTLRMAIQPTS
jgi:hypothetical protein